MKNTPHEFYGQQSGETILYMVASHPLVYRLKQLKIILAALTLWVAGILIQSQLPDLPFSLASAGFILSFTFVTLGLLAISAMHHKDAAYITDRRVIRFQAHNPFATTIRSLTWDQAAKTKTFPPNLIYKALMIGSVTVHSKTTVAITEPDARSIVTNDDITLDDVYYYKDLGNYIDKIIFTFNHQPDELKNLKPFVPKPKGQRY